MARPKEFDTDLAVERAMNCFWRDGYEATSIGALTGEMEIGRASLYGTFGSKDELFGRALEHYQELEGGRVRACLLEDGPPLERIEHFMRNLVAAALDDQENRGCFVLNAAAERPRDEPTMRRIRTGLAAMEDAVVEVLAEAQETGELAADRDIRALGRFIVTAANGARIMAKATRDRKTVDDAVEVALAVLK